MKKRHAAGVAWYNCRVCGVWTSNPSWSRWADSQACRRCFRKVAAILFAEAKAKDDTPKVARGQLDLPF